MARRDNKFALKLVKEYIAGKLFSNILIVNNGAFIMTQQNLVRIYQNLAAAEAAVKRLKDKNFPGDRISIVAQNVEIPKKHSFITTGHVAAVKGILLGAQVGVLLGILASATFIWKPGFSPLLVAAPFAVSLLGALKGMLAGAAAGGLLSVLLDSGLSKRQTINDKEVVTDGKYLVVIHGDETHLSDARILLGDLSDHRQYPVDAEKILRFLS
jgi:hypothetical protein